MAWLLLVVSGILETAWAVSLQEAMSRPRPLPILVFAVTAALSMVGLGLALRSIPVGTGYAVWVGIGAVGTVAYGIVALGEPATVLRLGCVACIVAGVVGLRFASATT